MTPVFTGKVNTEKDEMQLLIVCSAETVFALSGDWKSTSWIKSLEANVELVSTEQNNKNIDWC